MKQKINLNYKGVISMPQSDDKREFLIFNFDQSNRLDEVFQETADYYERKYGPQLKRLMDENRHLKGQLSNLNKKIKQLRFILNKKNKRDKQYYKNGKRGTFKNGG